MIRQKKHHPVFKPLYQIERGEKDMSRKEALQIGKSSLIVGGIITSQRF